MEKYQTYIYQKDPKKIRKFRLTITGHVAFAIVLISILAITPEVGVFTIIGLIVPFIKTFQQTRKSPSIKDFGRPAAVLLISREYLEIDGTRAFYHEMDQLIIYVDEYAGMTKELFFSHSGGNNEIRFSKNGKVTSFNYYIASKGDYHYMEHLVARIEEKYPPKVN